MTSVCPVCARVLPSLRLQPVSKTRERQLSMWADLITAYANHTGCHVLDIVNNTGRGGVATGEAGDASALRVIGAEIFTNDRIKRSLPGHARTAVVDELITKGRCVF